MISDETKRHTKSASVPETIDSFQPLR